NGLIQAYVPTLFATNGCPVSASVVNVVLNGPPSEILCPVIAWDAVKVTGHTPRRASAVERFAHQCVDKVSDWPPAATERKSWVPGPVVGLGLKRPAFP